MGSHQAAEPGRSEGLQTVAGAGPKDRTAGSDRAPEPEPDGAAVAQSGAGGAEERTGAAVARSGGGEAEERTRAVAQVTGREHRLAAPAKAEAQLRWVVPPR